MRKIKFVKYRIVTDQWNGFEAQIWRLWFPFWWQMGWTNTHASLEDAQKFIENYRKEVWRSE